MVNSASSPLTLLVLGSGLLLMFVLLRPWGGLKRVFGLYPAVRAVLIGTAVAGLIAGTLDGAGFTVAGAVAATAVPLVCLAALRVLDRADERTPGNGGVPLDDATAAITADLTSDIPPVLPRPQRVAEPPGVAPATPAMAASPPAATTGDVLA